MPATFPRAARLLNADQYTYVFQHGHVIRRHGNVRVRVVENGGNAARIGVIVPKKGNRLAVRRNRIKRLIRNHFRLVRMHLKSVDIIVHVTGAVTDQELMRILGRSVESLTVESLTEEQAC